MNPRNLLLFIVGCIFVVGCSPGTIRSNRNAPLNDRGLSSDIQGVDLVAADMGVDAKTGDTGAVDAEKNDSTVDVKASDSTVDVNASDLTVDVIASDSTVDVIASDSTVDVIASDSTVDVIASDSTVDSGGTVANSFYSAVTGNYVTSYMSSSPFDEPAGFGNSSKTLNGGSTLDITNAIKSLSGAGGTLTISGAFSGSSAVSINGISNVRVVGNGATITVSGGGSFSDNYSGFVVRNSSGISIEGITIKASSGHGILVFGGCSNIRIKRNDVQASIRSSIIFYGDGTYTNGFEVSGNKCKNFGNEDPVGGNSHHGIVMRYVKKGLVIGNYVDGTANIGMSRMGMDISTNSWFVEGCHNKVVGTDYGAKIGYQQTQYVYFHDNHINSMNDGHHGDKAFYVHRTLGGPIFVENNVFWDDYINTGDYDLYGAGCTGGVVYVLNNTDKNGNIEKANKCAQDVEGSPAASVMQVFKDIGN